MRNEIWVLTVADPGFGEGGPNWSGGPNFEMGRILYSYSLLGAKQRKMYALTLGLEGPRPPGPPLDLLLIKIMEVGITIG